MPSFDKRERVMVRFTPDQYRRLKRAVDLEQRRRKEIVGFAALIRELTVRGIDDLLAEEQVA